MAGVRRMLRSCTFLCTVGDGGPPPRKRFVDGTAPKHGGAPRWACGDKRDLLATIAVVMVNGEAWSRAHLRPNRKDAMVDAECAV